MGYLEGSHINDLFPVLDSVRALADTVPKTLSPDSFADTLTRDAGAIRAHVCGVRRPACAAGADHLGPSSRRCGATERHDDGRLVDEARAALWRFLLAACISAILLIVIANEIRQPIAATTRTYSAEFTDVSGLSDGADVRVRGVRVGKVKAIELKRSAEGRSVAAVQMTLDKRFSIVPTSRLAVRYQALTGLRYVDVQNPAEGDAVSRSR